MSALPCLLCGKELDQRSDKHGHPYFVCDPCGLQMFVRRKQGIENLQHLINTLEERKLFMLEHSHVLFEIRAILEELDGLGHELEKLELSTNILAKTPKQKNRAKRLLKKRMQTLLRDLQGIVG